MEYHIGISPEQEGLGDKRQRLYGWMDGIWVGVGERSWGAAGGAHLQFIFCSCGDRLLLSSAAEHSDS